MDPMTIAAIVSGVGTLFGAIGGKKRANAQQQLEQQQYDDQVRAYYDEARKAEEQRLQKVNLVTAFARANGIDGALTPAIMEMISKRREPVAPPPYRKGGTPGFGWDLAGSLAQSAGAIYGAHSAGKVKTPASMGVRPSFGSSGFGGQTNPFMRPAFTSPVSF